MDKLSAQPMSDPAQLDGGEFRIRIRRWRDNYIPIVDHFCPFASPDQREVRCSLLQLRDLAASHMRYCSEEAYHMHWEIVGLVSEHTFSPMALDDLKAFRADVARLLLRATGNHGSADGREP